MQKVTTWWPCIHADTDQGLQCQLVDAGMRYRRQIADYRRVAACADRHAIRRHPDQGHGLRQRAGDRRPGSGLKIGA